MSLEEEYLQDLKEQKTRDPQLVFLRWLDTFKKEMIEHLQRIEDKIDIKKP